MRSHNSGNIHGENLHIWAVERKKLFLENWNIFSLKNYTTIIRTYWATKYESRGENEFWATCQNISNFDGCWHPLLGPLKVEGMQLLTRGEVDVTCGQHLCHHLNNSKPKQSNSNIIKTVMFGSPFASNQLHGYVELNCTDSHKYTNWLSIERQRCHTIWIFLPKSRFYVNFMKDFLFVYFGFFFAWLCFLLVCVNFVKFRKDECKLLFYSFHSLAKGGRRSMLWKF